MMQTKEARVLRILTFLRQIRSPRPSSRAGVLDDVLELGTPCEPLRVTLRPLRSRDDYDQCKALQRAAFGLPEIASATVMKSCQEVAGLAAGAFDVDVEMLGCIFGISGLRDGKPAHWSNLTAVKPDTRGLGLGRRLKAYQRDFLLRLGIKSAYWSYDPLVARNAHFNLNRLGAEPIEYVRDYYGASGSNELLSDFDNDRFVVEWRLDDPRVDRSLAGGLTPAASWRRAPVINAGEDGKPLAGDFELVDAPAACATTVTTRSPPRSTPVPGWCCSSAALPPRRRCRMCGLPTAGRRWH